MHTVRCPYSLAAVALIAAAHSGLVSAGDQAGSVPRYKLEIGQELVYRGDNEMNYDGGQVRERITWNVWVIGENEEDGSWRLIIRHANNYNQGGTVYETVTFACCDLYPDGRMVE